MSTPAARDDLASFDWSATPIGARAGWSDGLETLVSLMGASGLPMLLLWGPELTQIDNDAYRAARGAERGRGARSVDAWRTFGTHVESVLRDGATARFDDAEWRYECVPVRERGLVVGAMVTSTPVAANIDTLHHLLRTPAHSLATLSDALPQLAWSARPDGFIDWYNQRWYDYTGTGLAESEGDGWRAVHQP